MLKAWKKKKVGACASKYPAGAFLGQNWQIYPIEKSLLPIIEKSSVLQLRQYLIQLETFGNTCKSCSYRHHKHVSYTGEGEYETA